MFRDPDADRAAVSEPGKAWYRPLPGASLWIHPEMLPMPQATADTTGRIMSGMSRNTSEKGDSMNPINPIICPVRNNRHLTMKAVATFKKQDIGDVEIIIVNNASTDGTSDYLRAQTDLLQMHFDPPASVAESWNRALTFVFAFGAPYALVVNNDVELRPDTYRLLVEDGGGFVTAVGRREWEPYAGPSGEKRPHPDFSCFLIRKEVYERVGPFDENFKIAFCEDWDYHVRLHKAGVAAYCIDLPFLHHGSMTIKMAELSEVRKIQAQAEKNREYFRKKWGFAGSSKEYEDFFKS